MEDAVVAEPIPTLFLLFVDLRGGEAPITELDPRHASEPVSVDEAPRPQIIPVEGVERKTGMDGLDDDFRLRLTLRRSGSSDAGREPRCQANRAAMLRLPPDLHDALS